MNKKTKKWFYIFGGLAAIYLYMKKKAEEDKEKKDSKSADA